MRLTLYEIETTLRKAGIGAGLPAGLAEDIGCAAAWLAGRDLDGVKTILKAINAGMSKTNMCTKNKGFLVFPEAKIAVCGPSAIDLLVGEKTCKEVHLLDPDSAMLLVGFAGIAADHHDLEFQFGFSNGVKVQVSAGDLIDTDAMPVSGCDITLTCQGAEPTASRASTQTNGIEVPDETWREVEALAARTYVPESKDSRATGAGADFTDND